MKLIQVLVVSRAVVGSSASLPRSILTLALLSRSIWQTFVNPYLYKQFVLLNITDYQELCCHLWPLPSQDSDCGWCMLILMIASKDSGTDMSQVIFALKGIGRPIYGFGTPKTLTWFSCCHCVNTLRKHTRIFSLRIPRLFSRHTVWALGYSQRYPGG